MAVSLSNSKTVAVLVRTRNEAEYLPKLIEELDRQDLRADEVILVDSGSTDSTIELALAAGWKVARLKPEEFSYGRSLNEGFRLCSSDVVVILSAHVYPVRSDYLAKMTTEVEPRGNTVVYGRQVGDVRTKFSERMVMSCWFPSPGDGLQDHPFMNNASSCVPKALWQRLLYDEALPGLEDIEFAKRLQALGGRVVYESEAPIVHVHEETYRQVANRYRREAAAYRLIFRDQGISLRDALRLAVWNIWRDSIAAARERKWLRVWRSIVLFRASQFYGAWRGFQGSKGEHSPLIRRMYFPCSDSREVRALDSDGRSEE